MGRLKRKFVKFNVDADIESQYQGDIIKIIDLAAKKLTKITKASEEMKPMTTSQRENITPILEVIGKRLSKLDIMQKIEISKIIKEMNENIDEGLRGEIKRIFNIETRLEMETLTIERLLREMIDNFRGTGEKKYVYNFLSAARKLLFEELKKEKEKKKAVA